MKRVQIQESKHAFRQRLAKASIVEKLRMLDALREGILAIRGAAKSNRTAKSVAGKAVR